MIKIMVSCQDQSCAEETSFDLDMVRMFEDKPICEKCYVDFPAHPDDGVCDWSDLPEVTFMDLDLGPGGQQALKPHPHQLCLAMVQDLARVMLKTGGASPYDYEAHKKACFAMTRALTVIAEQEDVL